MSFDSTTNLLVKVENLCRILNSNGIKKEERYWKEDEECYKEIDWHVYDKDEPRDTFQGGFAASRKAFKFLKDKGLIDIGTCWHCGKEPIKNEYTFTHGSIPEIRYFICKSCYQQGAAFHKAFKW